MILSIKNALEKSPITLNAHFYKAANNVYNLRELYLDPMRDTGHWTVINPVVILGLKNVYLVTLSFYGKSSKMSQKREGIYKFSVENGVCALGNGMKLAKK